MVHEQFKSAQIEYLNDDDCEFLSVKIDLKPISLVIYAAYVNEPHRNVLMKHYSLVKQVVQTEHSCRVAVMGDFNLHDINWNLDDSDTYYLPQNVSPHADSLYYQSAAEFLEMMHQLPLYQLSNEKNIASNVLDLVFVNDTEDIRSCKAPVAITRITESDRFHPPLEVSFEYQVGSKQQSTKESIEVFSYKRGNYDRMSQQINNVNFAEVFDRMDIESAFSYFYDLLQSLVCENVPRIRVKVNCNKPIWWTQELQSRKNKRDKLYKRKPKHEPSQEYEEAVKEFNELHDELYKKYINEVQSNIIANPAAFWSYARSKKKTSTYPTEMHFNGRKSEQGAEIVGMFADYFESVYEKDDEPLDFEEEYGDEMDNAREIQLTMWDIERAIKKLEVKSSPGPDKLSPIILKECADAITWPLWILHQKSMELGTISEKLKVSRVVPIYKKKGDKRDVKNYRIVAISSAIMRVYESAFQQKLSEIIEPMLSNAQHGFRPKRSVVTNMMNLSIVVHEAFSNRQQVDIFYGDFANAFDKLWHRIFITKMRLFNIGKRSAKWMFEFLNKRKFYVKIGKYESRVYEAASGVPAGSILGPTMFLMAINDIVYCVIHAVVLLFADDIKLAMAVTTMDDTRCLQSDIDRILQWSQSNRLPFNQQKCEVITLKRRNDFCNAVYKMGNHTVDRKSEVRDVGFLVDMRFQLIAHMERNVTKARQMMGYIKSISKGQFGERTLRVLFVSYVRSRLEFGSVIWDPHQLIYSDLIESVQKQFVIFALGDSNRIPPYTLPPYESRCAKLRLDTLVLRRKEANLMIAYDLYNKIIDDPNIQRKLVRRTSFYTLRQNRVLDEDSHESDYGYYQPIARVIRAVNEYGHLMTLSRSRFKYEAARRLREEAGVEQ